MSIRNNNQSQNTILENIFSKIPKRCNCTACVELHNRVKQELGLSKYEAKCDELGIHKQ